MNRSFVSPVRRPTGAREVGRKLVEAEYGSLREEILQNDRLVVQLFQVGITASMAALGWAINEAGKSDGSFFRGVLFLVPIILAITFLLLVDYRENETVRVASYISVFLEPHGKGWENRLHRYLPRYEDVNRRKPSLWDAPVAFPVLFTYACVVLAILSTPDWRIVWPVALLGLASWLGFLRTYVAFRRLDRTERQVDVLARWRRVWEEEAHGPPVASVEDATA